jgi:polygalacturonase
MRQQSRREFVRKLAIGAGSVAISPYLLTGCSPLIHPAGGDTNGRGWDIVPGILRRIVAPTFPDRDFDITKFGAAAGGSADCTEAFRSAIDACVKSGGGRVVVPEGKFLTGAIHLQSNVNLHVKKGATILFSTEPSRYLPVVLTRFEGVELMGYSPLIYAVDCVNVAVTGEGTLDGQANDTHWWPWKGTPEFGWKQGAPRQNDSRKKLFDMAENGVEPAKRVFGEGSYLRPAFIEPYRCRNVLIEGVTITNSPMWEIHPTLCENVTVRGVHISSFGPNNDGCDPESCADVLIENCFFNTGDDCIAIKSGRNADGRRVARPSENIIVRGCEMRDGHGGVTIGSEISGGVRNVFVENCRMDSPHLDRALRLKNNAARGGLLEHIYMRDVTVGQLAESVLAIDLLYEEGANGKFMPVIRDVEMLRVTSQRSQYGVYIRGFEGSEISGVRVLDCTFDNVAKGNVIEHAAPVTFRNVKMNGVSVS